MNDAGKLIVEAGDLLSKKVDRLFNAARKDDLELASAIVEEISEECIEIVDGFTDFLAELEAGEDLEVDWIPVESTALDRIGYIDEETTLVVQFKDDRKIHKYPVPKNVWLQLLGARSKGRFFQQNIRNAYQEIV